MYSLGEALTTLSGFDLYIFGCKKETPTSLKEGRRFKKFSLSPAADRSRDLIYHRRSGLSSSNLNYISPIPRISLYAVPDATRHPPGADHSDAGGDAG